MGWVLMSKRELARIEVLGQIEAGAITVTDAARVLNLGRRQVHRLLTRLRDVGPAGLRHQLRGRPSNRQMRNGTRDLALALVLERYPDFGPTLAAEKLAEEHDPTVSRETPRKRMIEDGIWRPRKERRKFHQPPLRRECPGDSVIATGRPR